MTRLDLLSGGHKEASKSGTPPGFEQEVGKAGSPPPSQRLADPHAKQGPPQGSSRLSRPLRGTDGVTNRKVRAGTPSGVQELVSMPIPVQQEHKLILEEKTESGLTDPRLETCGAPAKFGWIGGTSGHFS